MPAFLLETLKQIGAIWRRMSAPSRVAVATTILLAVGGLLVVTFWARTPTFVVLESEMDTTRASRIADELDGLGVPFRTRDGGTTILVPSGELSRLRLKLAGLGIVFGDDPAIEDSDSPFQPPEERAAIRVQKLQQEVARTITALDGVRRAKVIISPEHNTVYTKYKRDPKASIVVWPEGGRALAAYQVEGIVRTATNAVSGLTAENVSVVDGGGRPLTRRQGSDESLVADDALSYKDQYERMLEEKAAKILVAAVGLGRFSVAVTAVLEFNTTHTRTTEYDEERKVLEREKSTKETNPVVGGGGSGQGADGEAGLPTGKSEQKERNYLVPKKEIEEVSNTPRVLRVTAGITYDRDSFEGDEADLKAALANALGIEEQDLTLSPVAFAEIAMPEGEEESGGFGLAGILPIAQYAAVGLAGLGLLLFFRGAFRGRPGAEATARTGTNLDLTVGDEEEEDRVNPKVIERQKLKKEIARAIDQDPRGVAKLIEMWLHEESA